MELRSKKEELRIRKAEEKLSRLTTASLSGGGHGDFVHRRRRKKDAIAEVRFQSADFKKRRMGKGYHRTSSPVATCPGRKNVFTKSASPHTVIPGNRLNHLPAGTSGSLSSQLAKRPSSSAAMSCDRIRSIR